MPTIAHRIRLHILIYFSLISILVLGVMLHNRSSVSVDIQNAELLYRSYRPNYNTHFPDVICFAIWEKDAYPSTGDYISSTDYFKNLMAKEWITGGNYGIFSLPGVTAYWGDDPSEFSKYNNAWCVTLDIDPMRLPDVPDWRRKSQINGSNIVLNEVQYGPLLFSRNLNIQHLSDAKADKLENIPPYGLKGVLVVMTDGKALFIEANNIVSDFNPMGLTNAILRP